jgi:hypothetical protein
MTQPTRQAAHRRRRGGRGRSNTALTSIGILVALWLGLTAPSVTPVAGPAMHTVAHTVVVPAASGDAGGTAAGR